VAPEKIENVYMQAPIITQLFVDGDSLERFLVAIVVPDMQKLKDWYRAHVHDNGCTIDEICQSKETRAYVLAELNRIGKECKLNSIEQVQESVPILIIIECFR
jgi:long-chain acyl-CoA synthetase